MGLPHIYMYVCILEKVRLSASLLYYVVHGSFKRHFFSDVSMEKIIISFCEFGVLRPIHTVSHVYLWLTYSLRVGPIDHLL